MCHKLFNKIPAILTNDDPAVHQLTEKQILLLKLSDEDIVQGRLIPHDEVTQML